MLLLRVGEFGGSGGLEFCEVANFGGLGLDIVGTTSRF